MLSSTIGGRYEVLSKLGHGGMATVYRARDTRLMRDVAVKILNRDVLGDKGTFMFHREARAIAAMRHTNVVQVFDYSGPEEALAYIVMELIEGATLDWLIATHQPLSETAILCLTHALASALAHAHERGVIHRDLKPGNVMVEPSGRVLLTDFGVAKAYADPRQLVTVARPDTGLLGTPAFMAPEQIADEPVGPATDAFSLGSLVYCMAGGQSPFSEDTNVAEVLRRVLDVEYVPLAQLRPDVSAGLEVLVDCCLRRAPEERVTAAEVVRQCETLLGRQGIVNPERALGDLLDDRTEALNEAADDDRQANAPDSWLGDTTDSDVTALLTHTEVVPALSEPDSSELESISPRTPTALVGRARHPPPQQERRAPRVFLSVLVGLLALAAAAVAVVVVVRPTMPWNETAARPRVVETYLQPDPQAGSQPGVTIRAESEKVVVQVEPYAGVPEAVEVEPHTGEQEAAIGVEPRAEVEAAVEAHTEAPPAVEPRVEVHEATAEPELDTSEPDEAEARDRSPPRRKRGPAKRRERAVIRTVAPPQPAADGAITVVVRPWGKVWLDGEAIGNTPVLRTVTLPPGTHTIAVSHPSLGREERQVVIKGGERTTLRFDLRP